MFTSEPDSTWNIPNKPIINRNFELVITEEIVEKKLKQLNVNKSPGPDKLHPRILFELADVIAPSLCVLYNTSITIGSIPNPWKDAQIAAIHKKGDKKYCGNYRPISLTSVVCKVLESIVKDYLVKHMLENNLLSNKQFGFLSGRSTTIQLLKVLNHWTKIIDEGGDVDVVYCDFQKAFDKVPHKRLISVLQHYGVDNCIVKWITGFLSHRRQQVKVNNAFSEWHSVISGVPQGSVLGPILFIIYINTLVDVIKSSELYLFADDNKLYHPIFNDNDRLELQSDIDRMHEWSLNSMLTFHLTGSPEDKCVSMHIGNKTNPTQYTMNGIELKLKQDEKDLGVIIDSQLNFEKHISTKVNKANQIMGLIRRTMTYLDEATFCLLYKSLVRPHLEYANSVWSPRSTKNIKLVESVQRRATKLVPGLRELSYKERLIKLDLPTLIYRRYRGDMIEVYKIVSGLYNDSNGFLPIIETTTRGNTLKIFKEACRTKLRKEFFTQRIVDQWNLLPARIVTSTSLNIIKSKLDKVWKNSCVMYDSEVNIVKLTSAGNDVMRRLNDIVTI